MIVSKLRKQRKWSQEQLSENSGLSLRTIQRIEGGGKASMASLNALALAFETNVETLEHEVVVVDKESAQWKKSPLWVRLIFIGSNHVKFRRRDAVFFEVFLLGLGLIFVGLSFWHTDINKSSLMLKASIGAFLSAYYMSVKLRMGDKYQVW